MKFGIKNEGDLFRAESKYNSEFSLCGNQWHTVRAEYLRNVVKLNVDNQGDTFGISKAGHTLLPTNAPLFIGGVQSKCFASFAFYATIHIIIRQHKYKSIIYLHDCLIPTVYR